MLIVAILMCVFLREDINMIDFIIFSKNKDELINKVNSYLIDPEIACDYKDKLKEWKSWYDSKKDSIHLEDLTGSKNFYRAYYNNGIYGIQVWNDVNDDTVVWERNIYVSAEDVLDDENTKVL